MNRAQIDLLRSRLNHLDEKDRLLLRPPGALDEDVFLASCIKCGQCLQVCPPQVIKLAGISQGFGIGTLILFPGRAAVFCAAACPVSWLVRPVPRPTSFHWVKMRKWVWP